MRKSLLSKPLGHDSIRWLQTLVALLMIVGVFSVAWELVALHTQRLFLSAFDELEADVSSDDLLHLSYLQAACRAENNTVLPVSYAAPGTVGGSLQPSAHFNPALYHERDPRLVDELRQCPDVDIYMPASARDPAGCAAVAGPLKFLQSRLLPDWAFDAVMYDIHAKKSTTYFELCPHTPMLFLSPEHVLKLTKHAAWPATKPVYLLAPGLGVEAVPEGLTRSVLELSDVVLCQTNRCDQDVTRFLERMESDGTTKKPRVLYTSQVSVDPANYARRILGDEVVPEKNETHFVGGRFAHTTWDIGAETTQDVINCWNTHVNYLPQLDVFLLKKDHNGKSADGARLYKPFPGDDTTKIQTLDELEFARSFSNATFFVCPTAKDDCLRLARASGGVIVTGDGYPMNELLSSSAGVLFPTSDSAVLPSVELRSQTPDDKLLLASPEPSYRSSDLCASVIKAYTSTSVNTRLKFATQARRRFNEDAKLFMLRMLELRAFAHQEPDDRQQHLRLQN
ncbi:NPP1 protein [Phytophthora cinnamomi]|uniref:NPP1 protein n=1 Tax=Phytophthora cinnamomi TaxID=4785 RepID=UPI003559C3E1|nr:NPP1 protein [Phytophthora cinnamomi]